MTLPISMISLIGRNQTTLILSIDPASEARAVASMLLVCFMYSKDSVRFQNIDEVNFLQFLAFGIGMKNMIRVRRGHVGQVQVLNIISAPSFEML